MAVLQRSAQFLILRMMHEAIATALTTSHSELAVGTFHNHIAQLVVGELQC